MRLPRAIARARAWAEGYFWLPCSSCGEMMAGFEWVPDPAGHCNDIPDPGYTQTQASRRGNAICPACAARGEGCRAWLAAEVQIQEHECRYLRTRG